VDAEDRHGCPYYDLNDSHDDSRQKLEQERSNQAEQPVSGNDQNDQDANVFLKT
jgi:hypothetical protein